MARLEKDQSIELMNSGPGEFVNLSEELTDDAVSIEDIDEVLQTLERATSSETEIEEPLIEESSSAVESEEGMNEEVELDLSAGEMDKTSDPIRVYMREMGVVPLLTREQEVSIAKRIERGQKRAEKAIARDARVLAVALGHARSFRLNVAYRPPILVRRLPLAAIIA